MNTVVRFFSSLLSVDCTTGITQRASFCSVPALRADDSSVRKILNGMRARNAPILAAISIEKSLQRDVLREISEHGATPERIEKFDHSLARLDVLFSQVKH